LLGRAAAGVPGQQFETALGTVAAVVAAAVSVLALRRPDQPSGDGPDPAEAGDQKPTAAPLMLAAPDPPASGESPPGLASAAPPWGLTAARELRGRDSLVAELSAPENSGTVELLYGLGGVGKSWAALGAAARAREAGCQVWWVSATDSSSVSAGMRAVGYAAGATQVDFQSANAADVVWRHLERTQRPWLLVLDNADDPSELEAADGSALADGRGWVRQPPPYGRVLITSRDGSSARWGDWIHSRHVALLSADDGGGVLTDVASSGGTAAEAADLADRLGGLPLALRLAGEAIARAADVPGEWMPGLPRSFRAYQQALADRFGEVLGESAELTGARDARGLVGQTWELSLTVLERRSFPEARPLLRLLSCFGDAPLPFGLILDPAALAGSQLLPGMTGRRLWAVLEALASQSLISVVRDEPAADTGPVLAMHPLVRESSFAHSDVAVDVSPWLTLALELVSAKAEPSIIGPPTDPASWAWWQLVSVHCFHLIQTAGTSGLPMSPGLASKACAAGLSAGEYLLAFGLSRKGEAELRLLADLAERLLGEEDELTLQCRHSLARSLAEQDKKVDAEAEYRELISIRTRLRGGEDPETLALRHDNIDVLNRQGRTTEARNEAEAVLAARRRVLGEDHPDTLTTAKYHAILLCQAGSPHEAEIALRRILEAQLGSAVTGNAAAFSTWHNLAGTLRGQGLFPAALEEYTQLLELTRQQLGENHPSTLATRFCRAETLLRLGRADEAEPELRDVLERTRQQCGDDHHHTREARHRLACLLWETGRHEEATGLDAEYMDCLTSGPGHVWAHEMRAAYNL
jgi:tetratricopeptide (TPR) repeat protein